jgi:hypothetical protein
MISMLEESAWRRPSTCHRADDPRPDAGLQSEKLGAQHLAMVIGQARGPTRRMSPRTTFHIRGKSSML